MKLNYLLKEDFLQLQSSFANFIMIGNKNIIEKRETVAETFKDLVADENEVELLCSVAQTLNPSRDTGATAEVWLAAPEAGSKPRKVVLCALPTDCSRHNSPAKPHAISKLVGANKGSGPVSILLCVNDPSHAFAAGCAAARPFHLFSQKSNAKKSEGEAEEEEQQVNIIFNLSASDVEADFIPKVSAVAEGIQMAARLVDAPTCVVHTDYMVEEARGVADLVGAQLQLIQGSELEAKGYGGIWGIGKAAARPPALAILSYVPEGSDPEKAVALVGKGIVYDTGGLSIKTKTGMPGMKRDMGGAASLLAAFKACVQAGCSIPLYCLLCLAENSVSEAAVRPDDILLMYSGKTVEINNTDAEGRVVLGDGVAHAVRHLNPQVIIDMATLTGAQGVSTGKNMASLYCNNEELEALAVMAGRNSGDLCHAMPFCPEFYRQEFSSSVADMKNSVKDRLNAQVSCAGQFIGNHLGDFLYNGQWIHIDMAYPSFSGERATGFGVALVFEMIQCLQNKS